MIHATPKILVVTPSLPFPISGAEQSDRACGIKQLVRLGYDVRVVLKTTAWQTKDLVSKVGKEWGAHFIPVSYKYSNKTLTVRDRITKFFLKMGNPLLIDGAALEYHEPEIQKACEEEIKNWQPDIVWCDYTYLWPLYVVARRCAIPVITRSINFEPTHFLQEDGNGPLQLLRAVPKVVSEYITATMSAAVMAITPKEGLIYKKMGARAVHVLPLRGLPGCMRENHPIREKKKLEVFFFGSTYNVAHNREALLFIVQRIVPYFARHHHDAFRFNILGGKIPLELSQYIGANVTYRGYVEDLDFFLENMDIALIPSLGGAGMQQKIFEPICRGIPTIASNRGISGYPFEHARHLYLAHRPEDFITHLITLRDRDLREKLSKEGSLLARKLFSQDVLDSTVTTAIDSVLHRHA